MKRTTFALFALPALALIAGCRPELPVTSSITIDMESATIPLNEGLYGLCMVAGSGGEAFSAELVRNNSFDLGDSLPGWKTVAAHTFMSRNANRPLSADNPYSLMVSAYMNEPGQRGGVAAEGYGGLSLKRGEKYFLSFYIRTSISTTPEPVEVALEDAAAARQLSRPLEVMPAPEWKKYTHTFVATEDATDALLAFSLHKASYFWLDKVSLVPEKTWNGHGLRPDVMEMVDSLVPSFILCKGQEEETREMYRQMANGLDAEFIPAIDSLRAFEKSFYADENYLVSGQGSAGPAAGNMSIWVNGLASMEPENRSTLRAAVAEACFLVQAESNPRLFSRIAFAPVAGNYGNAPYPPLIFTGGRDVFASPSYYLLEMFAHNRGNVILPSHVNTYSRPQAEEAAPAFDSSGDSFAVERLEALYPHGAGSPYNYEVNAVARQVKEAGKLRLQINRSMFMAIGEGKSVLYRQAGGLRDTLSVSQPLGLKEGEPYSIRIVCRYDSLQCFLGDTLIHRATLPSLPSITAIATFDKNAHTILLKVVNSTRHNELTEIKVKGASIRPHAAILQMKGDPASQNTPASPRQVVPVEDTFKFPLGRTHKYKFPPNSITVMKLTIDN